MQKEKKLRGHVIRDALEQANKGERWFCAKCGRSGIVDEDLQVVYTEHSPALTLGRNYTVWGVCQDAKSCEQRRLQKE